MNDADDLVKEFLVESYENLDRLDQDFVALEKDAAAVERLGSIFRTIHTIKGTCGFLGFSKLESVAHVGESLLSILRDGELTATTEIISGLLQMVDAVREILGNIENKGVEGDGDYSAIVANLTRLKDAAPPPTEAEKASEAAASALLDQLLPPNIDESLAEADAFIAAMNAEAAAATAAGTAGGETSSSAASSTSTDAISSTEIHGAGVAESIIAENAAIESARAVESATVIEASAAVETAPAAETVAEAPVNPVIAKAAAPRDADADDHHEPAKPAVHAEQQKSPEGAGPVSAAGGIRVDVSLLDKLMNLVGELVLARNQILQFSATTENATLAGSTQRLNLITTELQEGVMKTRMQPIGTIWSKFPRIVRDVAQICGKQVRVEMEGRETELDKTIIEAIKDPLTHIIRNSVDHGIESADVRKAAGKSAEGRLFLRAFHEGGQVNIEIIDDGGGINLERVKKKAIERGLITAEHASRMSDREATNIVFLPGFSTAEKITNVSGRGVGMDVVKTNIEKIGGSVDIQSKQGSGTTLRIKIPLTLAIIPALIITSGTDRFAIPQVSLLELVRLEADQVKKGIERIRGTPVYRLRGQLLPLVDLNKAFHGDTETQTRDGAVNIVVLQADERQFGLVVDEINDTEEIVVKPLGKLLKGLTTFAGATIMGDGHVALILDVMGLAQKAGVISESKDRAAAREMTEQSKDPASTKQTLLLFSIFGSRRMAIPLSLVARLEEFPRKTIEFSGEQATVQYRGQIMPLISLAKVLSEEPTHAAESTNTDKPAGDNVQVIVYTKEQRSVGLIVDRIVDIVQETVVIEETNVRPGVLGSAVIDKRVTEIVDIEGVIFRTKTPATPPRARAKNVRSRVVADPQDDPRSAEEVANAALDAAYAAITAAEEALQFA